MNFSMKTLINPGHRHLTKHIMRQIVFGEELCKTRIDGCYHIYSINIEIYRWICISATMCPSWDLVCVKSQLGYRREISVKILTMSLDFLTFWSWWRHQSETFSALLTLCEGNPLTKASDTKLWSFTPEQTVEDTPTDLRHRFFETLSLSL